MRFYTYTTAGTYDDQIAILPQIDVNTLPMNTLQLSFDARNNSTYTFTLEVGVMTDPTDINTFMPINTIVTTSNTYANYEIPLSQYIGTGSYIALRAPQPTTSYNSGYVDNVVVGPIPSCPKPTQVHVVNASNSSIELGWTENGTATSWVIEYGPVGFTLGNGTEVNVSSNPYTISNLTASTQYDFYVKADCGGGDLSNYTSAFTAATECDAITQLPYTENFDTYGTGETAYPLCWGKINTYSSNRPYVNATHYEGVGSLYFYTGTSGTYNIAIVPQFDATIPVNTLQANFMFRATNSTDRLIVGVMTNPSDASTFVGVDTIAPSSTASTWVPEEVIFSQYTGTGQYIAFKCQYTSTSTYSYIDNLEIGVIPTCPKPQNVHIVDATVNSLELGWTEVGSATSWEIAYGDPGFDPDDATEATYATVTTNPFTVQNLTTATAYQFYVRALCGSNDISYWSNPTTGSTTMNPTSLPYTADFSDPTDEWVLNNGSCTNYWTRGTVGGDDALFVTDNGTTPNYTITSTSVVAAQKLFTVGTSDSITITFDVQVQGESSFDYMKLFLAPASQQFPASTSAPTSGEYGYNSYSTNAYDFYGNGYGSQSSYHYVMNMASGTVHVVATMPNPNASPTSTSTALLVFAWKNDPSVGTQPPATITNLTVTESGSGPGPVITDPTVATAAATAIAQTTATLNGTITNPDNVTITAKGFEWKATAGGTYQPVTVTGNNLTYNLTGLTANTGYTYKAFITFNGTTVYGNEVTFTTLPNDVQPCDVPTGLHTTNVENEAIAIAWDANPNVTSWNIQYRPVGGTLASATSTTNSYNITGLTGLTTYEIQVQADCGNGNVSDWCTVITAQTTNVGIEEYLLNSISLFPNPANDVINVQCTMNNVQVTALEVFDVYGKLIRTVETVCTPSLQTQINVSDLAAGMYFVRVTTEQGVATKSFVKK
ncbi:MAG: fibronectin type III domain-containing protein, partial [Bacteroidales bacterium]|nr:fibronectin type III domain-containing protein [Bacteroidales bacterium]